MCDVSVFFDTPGIGGAVWGCVFATLIVCYGFTIRWISKGQSQSQSNDKEEK